MAPLTQGFAGHHQPCYCPTCRNARGEVPKPAGRSDGVGVWHPDICRCTECCQYGNYPPRYPFDGAERFTEARRLPTVAEGLAIAATALEAERQRRPPSSNG